MTKATYDAMVERVKFLEAEVAKKNAPRKLTLKIGEKGGVVVSGLNWKFPVTLYAQQWERLIAFSGEITAFIEANKATLSYHNALGEKVIGAPSPTV